MLCRDQRTFEVIEKRLRPHFAGHSDFKIGFEYSEEEGGTRWTLFNRPIGKGARESMWPSISKLLKAGNLHRMGVNNFVETHFAEQSENIGQHILYLVVLCSPGMKALVASMRCIKRNPLLRMFLGSSIAKLTLLVYRVFTLRLTWVGLI